MANENEILIAFGKNKQDDISTANTAAGMWRLKKLNADHMYPVLNKETDQGELGNGHEWVTEEFLSHWDLSGKIEKYTSAEFAAWVMAYGLGKVVKSGSTPNFIYNCTPLAKTTDGEELPNFSFVEQMRPGASVVIDFMNVGCAIEGWTLNVASGPGRENSKLSVDVIGTGKLIEPSVITIPAATAEKLLPSASLAATINGDDYVTAKNFVSLEASFKNNHRLNEGFYPGCGFQTAGDADSGAIRGRLEVGDREAALSFVARYKYGSTEFTKLKAQTSGTAVVSLTYDTNNNLSLTYQKITYRVVELGGENGIVVARVTCQPMYHSSNGLLTAVAKVAVDGIAEAEA